MKHSSHVFGAENNHSKSTSMHAFYHRLGKTLNSPSMEAKCSGVNHKDFSRVITRLWLEVRDDRV